MAKRTNDGSVQVVWFKRDLRSADHRPLSHAAKRGPVLPLLVVEPELWRQPDMSARQYQFYRTCVHELDTALASLGQPLIIRTGEITDVLDDIRQTSGVSALWSHEETGNDWTFQRDRQVAAWCQRHTITWTQMRQDGVIRRLKNRDGWARKWDGLMAEPVTPQPKALKPLPHETHLTLMPTADELGLPKDNIPLGQAGGRTQGLATLSSFLHDRGKPYRAAMSSPITGERACSRVSPYLAWGAVSMREVAQTTWQRQRELKRASSGACGEWRASLISFTGRLHWHCHFMQKLEDEPRLEFHNLHRAYDKLRHPSESDGSRLTAWSNGETGLPFIDACMRYLAATGWLNFRMRAMLMATASYHLWLDWHQPGLHLARQFTDYEPGIHWPQAQMQSGTTGINTVRIYNPVKQGYDQDPDGEFVRRWIPELAAIEGELVHEPWKSPLASSILGKSYPMPIVDHMAAAREARQKIYGARKSDAFRQAAIEIQKKHGSRKSGIPNTGRKSKRRKGPEHQAGTEAQLSMQLDPVAIDEIKT